MDTDKLRDLVWEAQSFQVIIGKEDIKALFILDERTPIGVVNNITTDIDVTSEFTLNVSFRYEGQMSIVSRNFKPTVFPESVKIPDIWGTVVSKLSGEFLTRQ